MSMFDGILNETELAAALVKNLKAALAGEALHVQGTVGGVVVDLRIKLQKEATDGN